MSSQSNNIGGNQQVAVPQTTAPTPDSSNITQKAIQDLAHKIVFSHTMMNLHLPLSLLGKAY